MDENTLVEMGKRYPKIGPMLNVTFKKEGINALRLFWNLRDKSYLRFVDESLVMAILASGSWEKDSNRVVAVYFPLGMMWHDSLFLGRISRDIESIKLATTYPLNVLMTGRKKIQEDNFIRILHECYGDLNHNELPDFQLQLEGEPEIIHGLPQITFKLEALGETVATIILDGWSGQMIVDGVPQEKAYSDPAEFHEIVKRLAYEYVEKITSPA